MSEALWQPIETAPKDGSFLIANRLGQVCPVQAREGQRIVSNMPGYAEWEWGEPASHWMLLPTPPVFTKPQIGEP